jgi:hypothetical protein
MVNIRGENILTDFSASTSVQKYIPLTLTTKGTKLIFFKEIKQTSIQPDAERSDFFGIFGRKFRAEINPRAPLLTTVG